MYIIVSNINTVVLRLHFRPVVFSFLQLLRLLLVAPSTRTVSTADTMEAH